MAVVVVVVVVGPRDIGVLSLTPREPAIPIPTMYDYLR